MQQPERYAAYLQMDPDLYESRLDQSYSRLTKKADRCRTAYAATRYLTIVAGALIAASPKLGWPVEPVTIIGLLITLFGGIEQVMHYGSRFRDAATAKIALDRERTLYRTAVGEYSGLSELDAFHLLVTNCEEILFKERSSTTTALAPQSA